MSGYAPDGLCAACLIERAFADEPVRNAPFPYELAYRLVRVFSFTGDTVLDPVAGTGTTLLAAANTGRNAIGVEIDPACARMANGRLRTEASGLL